MYVGSPPVCPKLSIIEALVLPKLYREEMYVEIVETLSFCANFNQQTAFTSTVTGIQAAPETRQTFWLMETLVILNT